MNTVDVAVAVVVLVAALRGYLRGFIRELFGLLALGAAVVAAIRWSEPLASLAADRLPGPEVVRAGAAFVAIFLVTSMAVNIFGWLASRFAGALVLDGLDRAAGAVFGAAKGAAVVAVCLLFIHLFPPLATLDERVMTSSAGRPLMSVASRLLRLGVTVEAPTEG